MLTLSKLDELLAMLRKHNVGAFVGDVDGSHVDVNLRFGMSANEALAAPMIAMPNPGLAVVKGEFDKPEQEAKVSDISTALDLMRNPKSLIDEGPANE